MQPDEQTLVRIRLADADPHAQTAPASRRRGGATCYELLEAMRPLVSGDQLSAGPPTAIIDVSALDWTTVRADWSCVQGTEPPPDPVR